MLEKENIDLEIKKMTDYVLLNPSLADGQMDANFFQHIPYLEDFNEKIILIWSGRLKYTTNQWEYIQPDTGSGTTSR